MCCLNSVAVDLRVGDMLAFDAELLRCNMGLQNKVTAVALETQTINASTNALKLGGFVSLTAGSSRQMGVGTSTPGATLDVVGAFKASGSSRFAL